MNDVATTLPLDVYTHRNFVADFFRQNLKFTKKIAKLRFVSPFRGVRGNVHGSSMARWKSRGRLPTSANCFRQLSRLRRCEQILVEIVLYERAVGHFERKF